MAPKIFLTGATGYLGGDFLFALEQAHPEYEYTAIVRDSSRGAIVAAAYPSIRLVYGTNDDSKLIEEESSRADIVIHTADSSDHVQAAQAIAKGLAAGHSKEKPGFWLHTSGTGLLVWKDLESGAFGEPPSLPPYDDLENVSVVTSLPDAAIHRAVEKTVLAASSEAVKTAIISPPVIYGPGRGPGNKRSKQAYDLAKTTLEKGQPQQAGRGLTEWDNVHVHDLSDLIVLLVEAAIANSPALDSKLWGKEGYYFAENGHHVWGEVTKRVGEVAYKKGYIKEKATKVISKEQVLEVAGFEALAWGLNSRSVAKRARKYLGWKPHRRSLEDEIPDIVEGEALAAGVKIGHAQKAAGV